MAMPIMRVTFNEALLTLLSFRLSFYRMRNNFKYQMYCNVVVVGFLFAIVNLRASFFPLIVCAISHGNSIIAIQKRYLYIVHILVSMNQSLALVNCVSEPIYGNCQSCHQKLDIWEYIWEYGCFLYWIHTISRCFVYNLHIQS